MFAIYLPGFSTKNAEELESISQKLAENGIKVWARRWNHWSEEEAAWEPELYAEEALEQILANPGEEIVIVAKSLGTYVASRLLIEINSEINLKKVVLMGIPLRDVADAEKQVYTQQLPRFKDKLTIIQNEFDEHGTLEELKNFLNDESFEVIVKPGNETHRYNYPEDVIRLLS